MDAAPPACDDTGRTSGHDAIPEERAHRMTTSPATRRASGLATLPLAAGVLVLLNGLYILLAAFGNLTDFGTNQEFVRHVLAMDTTNFGAEPGTNLDDDVMWRAIENETVQDIAYIAIIAWEWLTGIVLVTGAVLWLQGRHRGYDQARMVSTIGLLMLILLFFGGFIVIGGEWFQMWRSNAWNGLDPAFRNTMLAIGSLILVHLPSSHWVAARPQDSRRHPS
jgi:predicted small integral membrane protein